VVTWYGDEDEDDEFEILVQRVDPFGLPEGGRLELSEMGSPGSSFQAFNPAIAAGAVDELLVVWSGTDEESTPIPSVVDEFEIRGQLLLTPLFTDGFESGDTLRWSSTSP
jgi:hypothetical protein